MKRSESPLKQLDLFCTKMHRFLDQEYATYQEDEFYRRYRDIQTALWETHTQLFFYFVTGEADFNAFYDRLAKRKSGRPLGWGGGCFIPDQMSSLMHSTDHSAFKERWAAVEALYKKCCKIESTLKVGRKTSKVGRRK